MKKFLVFIIFYTGFSFGQEFRISRPVKDYIQVNGSYLYGEPSLMGGGNAHRGIDLSVDYDTVYAAYSGTVWFIGYDPNNPDGYEPDGCGNYIFLKSNYSGRTFYHLYCHLSLPIVEENMQIAEGQPIAISGNTGFSTGPHLHFEIRMDSPAWYTTRSRRNPELWFAINGMGAVYGNIPNAPNNTRVDIYPDPKPRPPYTTFGYALTYNFNDPYIGRDDIYQENWAIGDCKPGTYTITALNGLYERVVTIEANKIVNADPITTVAELNTDAEYKMSCYPNPFNIEATIKYTLPNTSFVKIRLFNLLGENVDILFEGVANKGDNYVVINGSMLSSALYIAVMEVIDEVSGNIFIDKTKIILLK